MRISDWCSDVCSSDLAVARLVIAEVDVFAYVTEIGGDAIDFGNFDPAEIGNNPFFCPDAKAARRWEKLVDGARKDGSSLGAVVDCIATGVPAGWGAPLYAKLRSEEHTSELQSLMRISYAVFCLEKKTKQRTYYYMLTP